MALASAFTIALNGVTAHLITVEANIGPGLPGTHIVGLADTAISEARDRVRTAAVNSGLGWPKTKIVVSLSPASLPKSGSQMDLALTMAVLAAMRQELELTHALTQTMLVGEVGLDGRINPVPGVLPAVIAARERGLRHAVVPAGNSAEVLLADVPGVLVARTLSDVVAWASGRGELDAAVDECPAAPAMPVPDMIDVVGQPEARCAAEVAAAGGHHMMMVGPPGSGKSMIAARLPGLLPALTADQRREATAVHSVAGRTFSGPVTTAPFVAPHHSVTRAALLGGGAGVPVPGAVSLAHHGVLFLDEVSEIPASTLDTLRTPLEAGTVRIVRARQDTVFPARFQLVLAANSCRCGAEQPAACRCSGRARATYLSNLSGPLRDRIDIMVATHPRGTVLTQGGEERTAVIAERVYEARARSAWRWTNHGVTQQVNAAINPHRLRREFPADEEAMAFLAAHLATGDLTQRGVDRALKLSWTLCDLDGGKRPSIDHMARALELRGALAQELTA